MYDVCCVARSKCSFYHTLHMFGIEFVADVARIISVHETIWTIVNGQPHYTHVVSVENSVYIEYIHSSVQF